MFTTRCCAGWGFLGFLGRHSTTGFASSPNDLGPFDYQLAGAWLVTRGNHSPVYRVVDNT